MGNERERAVSIDSTVLDSMIGPIRSESVMQAWYRQEEFLPFRVGPDEARIGALLIHGFIGSPADMRGIANEFTEAGIASEGALVPGMASELDRMSTMTAEFWRQWALHLWDDHVDRYERRIVVGHSMGGSLALLIAAQAVVKPDLVVLLAPFTRIADWKANILPIGQYFLRELSFFGRLDMDAPGTRDWFAKVMPGLELDDPMVQKAVQRDFEVPTVAIEQLRRLGNLARREAKRIFAPTIIIQGHQDGVVLAEHTRSLVGVIPGLREYHEIGGDHMIPYPTFDSWPDVRAMLRRAIAYAGV